MRRITERRRPKAHPPGGTHGHAPGESCYRCRHGRGVIRCACRYARRASCWEVDHSPRARLAYAARLAAGLVLMSGRRLGPGVALVAARGVLPKIVPALGAVPALLKSAWVWIGGLSLATATAVTVGGAPDPVPVRPDAPVVAECVAVPAAGPACVDAPAAPVPGGPVAEVVGTREDPSGEGSTARRRDRSAPPAAVPDR